MTLKSDQKTEKKTWFVSKMTRICWSLTRALESLKNLHFERLLLCKVFNVWPKKKQRSYLAWQWRVMQSLNKNQLVVWKMAWGILQIFKKALESVKIGSLMGPFCPSTQKSKIYRGVMGHDNEKWCKIWRITDLCF